MSITPVMMIYTGSRDQMKTRASLQTLRNLQVIKLVHFVRTLENLSVTKLVNLSFFYVNNMINNLMFIECICNNIELEKNRLKHEEGILKEIDLKKSLQGQHEKNLVLSFFTITMEFHCMPFSSFCLSHLDNVILIY